MISQAKVLIVKDALMEQKRSCPPISSVTVMTVRLYRAAGRAIEEARLLGPDVKKRGFNMTRIERNFPGSHRSNIMKMAGL